MKLITLNVWGGRKQKLLADFFASYKNEVDIFCLQEVIKDGVGMLDDHPQNNPNFFAEISEILEDHVGYFAPSLGSHYGLAMFVRKNITVHEADDAFMIGEYGGGFDFENDEDHARNVQHLELSFAEMRFTVHNFHGMWTAKGKIDRPKRRRQAHNLKDHLAGFNQPQIIAGDFNSRPELDSMNVIESADLENLVKTYGITDTRTRFYEKPERYADYILVSPEIAVSDFRVLPEEVSDHAALQLEFSVEK